MQGTAEFTPEWFDASSSAWMANKKRVKGGSYVYVCQHVKSNGKPCKRVVHGASNVCLGHLLHGKKSKE